MTSTIAPVRHPEPRTIARVRVPDAARMRALRLEMLADSPLAFLETVADAAARPHEDFRAQIAHNIRSGLAAQFAAVEDGRFVGHAGGIVLAADRRVTVIFAVYVTPRLRGTGLVGDLIEAVARWSRDERRPELMLEVVNGNDRAVRAYERLGFRDTGVRVPHPTIPGLTELQMRRPA
ncbi:GNAT family N-acetyltransferase [Catenuloplanes indicus]|uniref:RimJ/RimL family protein N-acetyltransferase n=1 Tax=Catenuloplanes indicus TaxID=137267 RepID=A0AAE3W2H5_9ACTN|nr:GNAT family N-acetyltransferase [Catenuloplanes indicus]MDQ0368135.1 RimJ/RimL family protein N-acetyltransferase [Catenuloplanes indicus]